VESPKAAQSLAVLECEAARRKACEDFIAFYARMNPKFRIAAHVKYVGSLLDEIERTGEPDRVLCDLHPGSGKSEILAAWAAYLIARDPSRRVLMASSTASLAARNSRMARRYFLDPSFPFKGLKLGLSAEDEWSVEGRAGGCASFGLDSNILGRRATHILIDDAQSNQLSATDRDKLEKTFHEILIGRLEPDGVIVYAQQRLGLDDLPGRLLDAQGDRWTHIQLPALAEANDILGRAAGEPLDPQRFSRKRLLRIKFDVGETVFQCQYQGHPTAESGAVFLLSDFPRYTKATLPEKFNRIVTAFDTAQKATETSAFTAWVTIGAAGGQYYVLHVGNERLKYRGIVDRTLALERAQYVPEEIVIEDASTGTVLLAEDAVLNNSFAKITPIKPEGDKVARANRVSGMVSNHCVVLPDDNEAYPWQHAFINQITRFPQTPFADMTDAFVHCLSVLKPESNSMAWIFDGKMEFSDSASQARWDAFTKRENARAPQVRSEPGDETPEAFVERIGRMSESRFERELHKCNGHTGKKNRLVSAREEYIAAHATRNRGFDMRDALLDEPRRGVVLRGDRLHRALQGIDPFDELLERPDVRAFYGDSEGACIAG
jgi:predicted phage terminase large subunit-like protein